ncbi:hypothetical protein G210_3396 [Candida maltosa Xu316]|uniref:Uncharacterized protein n=1 Tax=Candida maltosa (strain Xu316) TaxID=1245528 RepID=M3IJ01_CANMX|nr:hypothetical protein G210_3396 [Candida maltosa Xu316]
MDTKNTLSDVDEFLELIHKLLLKQDNYRFAVLDFIIAMPDMTENLRNQIIDSLVYIFKPGFDVMDVLNYWKDGDSALEKSFEYDVLHLKRVMMNMTTHQEISNHLIKYPHITNTPGWLSSIFPRFNSSTTVTNLTAPPEFQPFIDSSKYLISQGVCLNELDTSYILHTDSVKPYSVFSGYAKTKKLNKHIITYLIKQVLDKPEELAIIYKKGSSVIDDNLLFQVLDILFPAHIDIWDTLAGHNSDKQEMILTRLIGELSPEEIQKLIVKFDYKYKFARILITTLTTNHKPEISQLISLVNQVSSKHTLLEINRSTLLRAKLIDDEFVVLTFNRLIELTLPRNSNSFNETFQASKKDFHKVIRSYSQTLSLISAADLSQILNSLHKFIKSESFHYHEDPLARDYLMKVVCNETFHFLKRSKSSQDFVLYTHQVSQSTNLKWVNYWLFKSMVLQDYEKAIKLVELYKDEPKQLQKYIPALISGIIHNENLDTMKKLVFLDTFMTSLFQNGFNNIIQPKQIHELIMLIRNDIKKSGTSNNLHVKSWLLKKCHENKNFQQVLESLNRKEKRKAMV